MAARGREILDGLAPDQRAVVIVSRPYNGCDPGANLAIPRKLRDMGVLAIPMDFLPLEGVALKGEWQNMYWRYGQKILAAAEVIADDPRLHRALPHQLRLRARLVPHHASSASAWAASPSCRSRWTSTPPTPG